jgi:[ribosomal protein S18]-alanine N-acetyltransferase
MSELIIRRAVKEDIEALAYLEALCFSSPWSREAFVQDITGNPLARYFIATENETPVAYGGLWMIFPEGHITNIAVHPKYRQRGIGAALLKELILKSEEEGITSHTLEVRVSNRAALGLYYKFGFSDAGIRKNYYEDTKEDALILWRESMPHSRGKE